MKHAGALPNPAPDIRALSTTEITAELNRRLQGLPLDVIHCGDVLIAPRLRQVIVGDRMARFSPMEMALLVALARGVCQTRELAARLYRDVRESECDAVRGLICQTRARARRQLGIELIAGRGLYWLGGLL